MQQTYGFSKFFEWFMGGIAVLGTLVLGWVGMSLVDLGKDVAVLKDRPQPVSQETFNVRMESVERRLTALEEARK